MLIIIRHCHYYSIWSACFKEKIIFVFHMKQTYSNIAFQYLFRNKSAQFYKYYERKISLYISTFHVKQMQKAAIFYRRLLLIKQRSVYQKGFCLYELISFLIYTIQGNFYYIFNTVFLLVFCCYCCNSRTLHNINSLTNGIEENPHILDNQKLFRLLLSFL